MRKDYTGGLIAFSRIFSFFATRVDSFKPYFNTQFRYFCITSDSLTTTHTFSPILRQCIDEKSLTGIKNIQAQMLKSGFPIHLSGSKLVDASLKCGEIGYARKLFDEMPERHIVTWNSLIAFFIKHRRSKEAVAMYRSMITNGVSPDEYTLSSVFKAFSDLRLEKEAQRSHGVSVILGLEVSNVFVGSALVDMYVKFGKTREAKLVLDRVEKKDVVLITALIVGYSQKGEDEKAVKLFQRMLLGEEEKVRPNEYTYASVLISCGKLKDLDNGKLIHGLMVKSGFESALASVTSLLTMYLRCGLIDDSLRIFECIEYPNQVTWTSLISGLVQNGREETALRGFRIMIRDCDSIKPNSFTLSSVLRGCSNLAMFEEGRQIQVVVIKYGFDRDKYCGTGLIDLYGKCGFSEMARCVFDSLNEIDVISLNTMMYSYAQNGFGHEAIELYERLINLGLEPNEVTVLSVLLACNNSGLVKEGCEFFDSFKKMKLTNEHYACMVDMLGRAGRLEEAEKIINEEVMNPDLVLWRTLINACKIHKNVEIAERIKRKILEIAPGDEGTLILMSNLYASMGKWNRVIEVKTEMKETKLKKNPAMSWVEIGKETHIFMAGDISEKRIIETLEELIKKAKDFGYVEDLSCVFQDMDVVEKERSLHRHSEKLAIAFAVWRNVGGSIRIMKNLRVCVDCHNWIKIVSRVVNREIVCRDAKRFHRFRDGSCSCGDYW